MSFSIAPLLRLLALSPHIIGLLLTALLLSGCSAVRLGYNSSPSLVYWWLDGYFDFDGAQSLKVRADLQSAQDWHRKTELPLLVQLLKDLQTMAPKQVTSEQVCLKVNSLQTRIQAPLERMVPTISAIAPTLQAAQLEQISREFDKRNRKWREEWIDGTLAERTDRRVSNIVERTESFYGTLTAAQVALIRKHIANSSFNGPRQLKEAQARQQDALQVLADLVATRYPASQANAMLRTWLDRIFRAPDPAYREYIDQLTTESCATMAALHNSSNATQRAYLVQTLRDYEEDARVLASQKTNEPVADTAAAP